MKPLLPLTLFALSLGACAAPPAADLPPSAPPAATPAPAEGEFLPGGAFMVDDALSAGPNTAVSITTDSAEAVRLRYERGTEETLEWPGGGSGEAVLLNHYGQQVWALREGDPAQRVTVPAGTYRLAVRNLDTDMATLTRSLDAAGAALSIERLGDAAAPGMSRGPDARIEAAMQQPSVNLIREFIWDMNLEGRTYDSLQVYEAYLRNLNLDRVKVASGQMTLGQGKVIDVTMRQAEMPKAYFNSAIFSGVDMTEASMPEADFTRIQGFRAKMPRAALSGAKFVFADLWAADLSGADLTGANLSYAQLNLAKLPGAKLSGARLTGAVLTNANLAGADLRGADLSGARLMNADFSGADLTGVDLSRLSFPGVTVKGMRIGEEVVQETRWYNGEVPARFL
ncbi:MAG: pentapeptide repeat-containing protein [Candidatus Sericytochromatia bacterium]